MPDLSRRLVARAAGVVFGVRRAWYRLRYPRSTFGPGLQVIGRLKIGRGTRVEFGPDCRIRSKVIINGGGTAVIGGHTRLNGTWIVACDRVEVGAWGILSDCGITDADHHDLRPRVRHDPAGPRTTAPVTLGRNVWVGLGALVLKGAVVGDDSVVGAGSVVRGRVPEGVVVAGNPAEIVKKFRPEDRTSPSDVPMSGVTALPPRGETASRTSQRAQRPY